MKIMHGNHRTSLFHNLLPFDIPKIGVRTCFSSIVILQEKENSDVEAKAAGLRPMESASPFKAPC